MNQPIARTRTNPTPESVRQITVKTKFTKAPDTTGWLKVRREPSGEFAYLPEFVKVVISKETDRTHFLILEGVYKGETASLTKENAAKCLVTATRGTGAKIVAKTIGRQIMVSRPKNNKSFNQLVATLHFNGQSAMITLDSDVYYREELPGHENDGKVVHSKPLPKGTYRIMAPQYAGAARNTAFYVTNPGGNPDLKYHTVWFPIEYAPTKNSNFVHVGNMSEGCVTMYDLTMWNPLYRYLISNRSDKEGLYVGTVTIE